MSSNKFRTSLGIAASLLLAGPVITAQTPPSISFTTWHMRDDFNNLSAWFIVAADQDKDGDVDFMGLANSGGGNALLFFNNLAADGYTNADGTPRIVDSSQGFNRQHVRFWDGNNDGYLGYVATDRDNGLVYRDRTAGGLDASEQTVAVTRLTYLDTGDIDGDGSTDVVAIGDRFNPNVRVFYNQAGTLVPGAIIAYPGGDWDSSGVRLADFDGDGRLDIVFTKLIDPNSPAATYNVYRNNGDGSFTGFALPKNLSVRSLGVGDANGDGKPDVFVAADGEDDGTGNTIAGTGGVYLFTNTTSGGNISFSSSRVYSIDSSHYIPALDAGDLNGDGFADIVFAVSNGDASASQHPEAWASDGNGNFSLAWTDTGANVVADTVSIIKYNGRPAIAAGGYRGAYLFANFSAAAPNPPSVTVPGDITAEATSASGATVIFSASAADDSGPVAVACSPASGSTFALGTTKVTCTATNAGGNASNSFYVTVRDTTAPTITSVAPSTGSLWPPNKAMVPISIAVSDTDAVTASPSCQITSVSSNEPGPGEWQVTGALTVKLQSDRLGSGNGRIYTIGVSCTDASGNPSATKTTTVTVPHDQGKK